MDFQRIKVVVVGDAGVGKTSLIKRMLGEDFSTKYQPTLGVDICPISFQTNRGIFVLDVWDCAGQEKFGVLRNEYYINAKACIGVYDVTSSRENVWEWVNEVKKISGKIPTFICGNKIDIKRPSAYENEGIFFTSSKLPYTIEDFFIEILREITGFEDLVGGSQMKNSSYYK